MTQNKLLIIIFAILSALSIKAKESNFRFINLANYQQLTGSQRTSYTKGLQLAVAELESSLQRNGMDVSQFGLFDTILPRSFAATKKGAWGGPKCIIGGVIRSTIDGLCPTRGRGCNGEADGFQCGKIYGKDQQACISRVPTETISERCKDKGKGNQIPADDYAAITQDLDLGIKDVCQNAPDKGRDACDKFWVRVNELSVQHKKEPPAQLPWNRNKEKEKEEKKEEAKGKDSKQEDTGIQSFLATQDACDPIRDQGARSTCHAFCLTCVYDNAMARATKESKTPTAKPFRVSANWIAMISVVKRMCDEPRDFHRTSDEMLKTGWKPGDNLKIMEAIGACAEDDYIPYDKNTRDWGTQFRSKATAATKGINPRPQFDAKEMKNWREKFGIDPGVAYDLFCPQPGNKSLEDDLEGYEKRLAEVSEPEYLDKPDQKFLKCAKAALENKKKLKLGGGTSQNQDSCKNRDLASDNDRVNSLKKMLDEAKGPLPIVMTTDTEGHSFHCVTVTGYDDSKAAFLTINSWGTSTEHRTLPYDQAKRFQYAIGKNCPLVTGPKDSAGAPPASAPPARPPATTESPPGTI
ncbi:MAG: hypothetical protein IPJ71_01300 [Bdellovibrionales bacterium]|nr:hypothetical protein [Bdellovibrionales bacterium]